MSDSAANVTPLEHAILRTLIYADVFHFPLTDREIHHFLIGQSAAPADVQFALVESPLLQQHINCVDGYYVLRGCEPDAEIRRQRDQASAELWLKALEYGGLLARLPFVRMVAITGALAMRNAASDHDDIDYLIVTAPKRVWLTRLLVVIIVRLARLRGVELCPNYVLSESALVQSKRDLFMAHEIAQMIPLAGMELYAQMRNANDWMNPLLPNANAPFYHESDSKPQGRDQVMQRATELLLGFPIGDILEAWEFQRKQRKFAAQVQQPSSSAQIDGERAKGHFNDHGAPILDRYRARLAAFGLDGD
ncbi:MAG: hypothetical protein KF726_23085 [Anaerolineae bacterium]|nr:hypothetical protein [Anaerolineae bacterium]